MNGTNGGRIALAILTGIVTALPTRAAAQAGPAEEGGHGGRGFFQAGYMHMSTDDLDDALSTAGLPEMGDDYLTLGGAGFGRMGRFLIGGEGHAVIGGREHTAGGARRLTISGGYGLFRLGYLVWEWEGVEVYPLFGIGAGGLSLKIAERAAPTFDDVIADPETSSTLSTAVFMLDVGAAANYRVTTSERENRGVGGFMLGVQAGYAFAPAQSSWSLDGTNDVAGGPDLRIQGPYVRVSIGGWGRRDEER